MCCKKAYCGAGILVLGILLLLKDLGVWGFWGINPWTLAFLLVGCCMICKGMCKESLPAKKK